MGVKMAGHRDAVDVVLEHANGESLDAARNEEAIHGSETGPGGALDEIDFLGVFGAGKDDSATGGVAVTIEVFGHGVDDDVSAEFDRTLEVRAEESIVDHEGDLALVGQLGHSGNIGDVYGGIGGRL